MEGTIARLFREKGFGFIRASDGDGEREFFFHRSAVRSVAFESLREGDVVTFQEDAPSEKGPRAARVELE